MKPRFVRGGVHSDSDHYSAEGNAAEGNEDADGTKGPEQKPAYAADRGNNKKRAETEEKSALHDAPCSGITVTTADICARLLLSLSECRGLSVGTRAGVQV